MMETLEIQELWSKILQIQDPAVCQACASISIVRDFPKGGVLIARGAVPSELMFLVRGITRGVERSGKEITICFCHRVGDAVVPSAELSAPSEVNIEALTPVRVLCVPMPLVAQYMAQYPVIQQAFQRYLADWLAHYTVLSKVKTLYNDTERYQWFLKEYADIVNIIPDKIIASYLGMTPVTLSRIRKKLRESGQELMPEQAIQA